MVGNGKWEMGNGKWEMANAGKAPKVRTMSAQGNALGRVDIGNLSPERAV